MTTKRIETVELDGLKAFVSVDSLGRFLVTGQGREQMHRTLDDAMEDARTRVRFSMWRDGNGSADCLIFEV